jgi:hypothetical protein
VPVPVPGLRVPAGRPAPHPVLVQRRLDLDYAIHVCFANARTEQERQAHLQDREPEALARVTVYEPENWDNRIRRYYDEHPRSLYRVIQAIPG